MKTTRHPAVRFCKIAWECLVGAVFTFIVFAVATAIIYVTSWLILGDVYSAMASTVAILVLIVLFLYWVNSSRPSPEGIRHLNAPKRKRPASTADTVYDTPHGPERLKLPTDDEEDELQAALRTVPRRANNGN